MKVSKHSRMQPCIHLPSDGKIPANLQTLSLAFNSIDDDGMVAFSNIIHKLSNLQNLNLQDNTIGDKGIKAFSNAIKVNGILPNLQTLNIALNSIGIDGMEAFSNVMQENTTLPKLRFLKVNNLGDKYTLFTERGIVLY